jgi:hypothetical protein
MKNGKDSLSKNRTKRMEIRWIEDQMHFLKELFGLIFFAFLKSKKQVKDKEK